MTDLATVLDRLGGRRGLVDSATPPLVLAATNAVAGAAGQGDRALPLAVAAAGATAVGLGALRVLQGTSLAGVLRGLAGLVVAVAFALWTGRARDFFLPGIYVDAAYTLGLAASALVGHPVAGHVYGLLVRDGSAWRTDPRLRRVLTWATWGFSAIYAARTVVQVLLYRGDEPELLALAKVLLGWPLTAVGVVLTLRAARAARPARVGHGRRWRRRGR